MLAISYYTQADKKGRHVRHLRGETQGSNSLKAPASLNRLWLLFKLLSVSLY